MNYKILANIVESFHAITIAIMLAGTILQFFHPYLMWIHISIIAITFACQCNPQGECKITKLENWLRQQYDPNWSIDTKFMPRCWKKWTSLEVSDSLVKITLRSIGIITLGRFIWYFI